MWWTEKMRRLTKVSPWTALLIAAVGCGGGDKSPTGPNNPGPGDPGPGQQSSVEFQLAALGFAGLPADAQVEDCQLTRFYGGKIAIDPKSGDWQIDLKVHDDSGDWHYRDYGGSEGDGTTVFFDSQVSGISYEASVNGNATEIKIMYDWCANGVPDIQLVFDR
jgi:hypothetical protein